MNTQNNTTTKPTPNEVNRSEESSNGFNTYKMKQKKDKYGGIEEDTSLGALFIFFLIMITPILVAIFINLLIRIK